MAGTEAETLVGGLNRMRATFRWKADEVDAAGMQLQIGTSTLTIGGLLKHLALVEVDWFARMLRGEDPGAPWNTVDWDATPDWEFESAAQDSPAQLYELYDASVARARVSLDAALAEDGLDGRAKTAFSDGNRPGIRMIVEGMIEEYGRHTGHIDLLREAYDGRVGEDPPQDFNR
jgi:hypothetical protein